jgi:hypothetical protein
MENEDLSFLIISYLTSSKKFSTRRLDRALVPRRARRTSPLSKRCAEAMENGKSNTQLWRATITLKAFANLSVIKKRRSQKASPFFVVIHW